MPCKGLTGDYLCAGWRSVTERIRTRDGQRCRGCNRHGDDIRLEVHHRIYGPPGSCGSCVLTGVSDDDLITMCIECHDAVTDVRRRVRYAASPIVAMVIADPISVKSAIRSREVVTVDIINPTNKRTTVIRQSATDRLLQE